MPSLPRRTYLPTHQPYLPHLPGQRRGYPDQEDKQLHEHTERRTVGGTHQGASLSADIGSRNRRESTCWKTLLAFSSSNPAILADTRTGGFASQHCCWFALVRMNCFDHVITLCGDMVFCIGSTIHKLEMLFIAGGRRARPHGVRRRRPLWTGVK